MMIELSYREVIREAMREEMKRDKKYLHTGNRCRTLRRRVQGNGGSPF